MSDGAAADRRRVTLTLQRTIKRMGQWEYPVWHVSAIRDLDAADAAPAAARAPGDDGGGSHWPGLVIQLYRDAGEGYWYNLSSGTPAVFVVRSEDDDEDRFRPLLVTVNHDEAAAHLETDDTVLSIAMPPSIQGWLQAFVERHYRPTQRKKRKRTDWDEDKNDQERPRARRPVRDD